MFDRYGADALNYGPAAGPGPLIDWLCGGLAEVDGRRATPDELVITAGTSQLDLTTLFSKPADLILGESPTYHLAVRIFHDHPVDLIRVAADRYGLRIDSVKEALARMRKENRALRFLCTVPTFPTGASMAIDRRLHLLASAVHNSGGQEQRPASRPRIRFSAWGR